MQRKPIEKTKVSSVKTIKVNDVPVPTTLTPVTGMDDAKKRSAKRGDVIMRNIDIARSKISVIIDSLEGDDNEVTLKRNVNTAIKHLKDIYEMLKF
jgi:hypothetical protein